MSIAPGSARRRCVYHAVHTTGADGGVMVTGSHNPPDYNGFKFVLNGRAFFGDSIQELGRIIAVRRVRPAAKARRGRDHALAFMSIPWSRRTGASAR